MTLQTHFEISASQARPATHLEVFSARENLSHALTEDLVSEYIERFTELVPRKDISELSIKETCIEGRVTALVAGFSQPTEATMVLNEQAEQWMRRTAGDFLADRLVSEIVEGKRILIKSDHWIAYVSASATNLNEIILLPKAPSRNLVAMTDAAQEDLRSTYSRIITALQAVAGTAASYTSTWHMAPVPHCRAVSRMRVQITAEVLQHEIPEQVASTLRDHLEP